MKSSRRKDFTLIIDMLMLLFIVFMLVYIRLTCSFWQEPNLLSSLVCEDLSDGWKRIYTDGSAEEITLNANYYADAYEPLVIERKLPDNTLDNTYIAFRAKRQEVKVYVNGELRENFSVENGYRDVKKIVSRYIFVKLGRDDSGATVRIEGISHSDGERKLTRVYYGEKSGIITTYLKSQRMAIGVALTFLIVGVLSVVLGYALRISTQNTIRTDYMGWTMFLISIWDFSQSDFRDFFFNNISMISMTAALALLIISIPLALFFNGIQDGRYKKIYYAFMVVCCVDVPLFSCLVGARAISYSIALIPAFVQLFGLAAVYLILTFIDWRNGKLSKRYRTITFGSICVCLCGLAQTYRFYSPQESETGSFLCLGILALTVASFAHAANLIFKINSEKTVAIMASEAKMNFLATMSHEIRTPINAVLGMNEAIRRESSEENIKSYADDVDTAGNLLLTLINDILDFSKLEAGKMTLVNAPYQTVDVANFCVEMIQHKAVDKGLSVETDINKDLPCALFGDEIRIKQIIINLLNNAVKYTEKGKVTFKMDFDPISESKIMLKVTIKDTGRGIKQEDIGKLFSAFTRVDEKKNQKIEGTGLGLVIVSKFVDLMDGTIDVQSTYGKGSVFTVKIPVKVSDSTPVGKFNPENANVEKAHKSIECFNAVGLNVLVVDDYKINLKVFTAMLKDTQMDIETSLSGDDCLEKTKRMKYDVIFMDHMMPGKDGIETLKELKADTDNFNVNTPVIMMTANAIEGAREQYLSYGFTDYISKPFRITDIEQSLTKLLPERIKK